MGLLQFQWLKNMCILRFQHTIDNDIEFTPKLPECLVGIEVSAIGDVFRTFSFSAKEMKGQVSIIEEARRFAYVKMMRRALDLGANAIIAIDSDNTIGESICYLSLYGTAVYVEQE